MSDLLRIIKQGIRDTVHNEGTPALLGKADGTMQYVAPDGSVARDKVWARVGQGDSTTESVVVCNSVSQQVNLPVLIANRDGVPTVIRSDTKRANEFTGSRPVDIAPHAWTHGRLGPDALYITGLAFLPLQAHPSDPLAMTVTVEQAFYRYSNVENVFPTTVSSSLSSYIPTAPNAQHFIVLCLDRSINALAIIDGSSSVAPSTANPFTAAIVLAVVSTIAESHYPLAAIRFYTGQTTVTAQDIFMDLRFWGGEVGTIAFNDAEGDPEPVVTVGADDGDSDYPARRNHVHIIEDDAVTFAKMQNIATDRLIGRDTAATGNPEEISLGASLEFSGSASIQRAALTGDVTASANSNATTIANNAVNTVKLLNGAVTNAKLEDMADSTIKGRAVGAGSGDPVDLTAAQASTVIGSVDLTMADTKFIAADILKARDSGGLSIEDDGGNVGVFVEDGGQVGINNAAPLAPLHVGAGTDTPVIGNLAIYASNAGTTSIVARDSTNNIEGFLFAGSSLVLLGSATDHPVRLRTNNVDRVHIDATGVGIGNTAPNVLLHVGAGLDAYTTAAVAIAANIAGAASIVARDATDNTEAQMIAGSSAIFFGAATNHNLRLQTNNDTKMIILAGGNVGVGNLAPGYLFHVGAGADTLVRTETTLAVQVAGTATLAVRDATNDAEIAFIAASGGGFIGLATNHTLNFLTNNATVMTLGLLGEMAIKAGQSSGREAAVGGVMYVTTTQTGNVTTGEDVLATYTIPAATLAVNGDSLWFEAHGTLAANGNAKQVKVRFGTTGTNLVIDLQISTGAVTTWITRGRIYRTGAATQKSHAYMISNTGITAQSDQALNQTLSGAITFQVSGEATATNDIVLESLIVGWDSNNT